MADPTLKVTDRRWWAQEPSGDDAPAAAEEPRLKPKYVEDLEAQLAAKNIEIQELIEKYRGASTEFDHARARLRKELSKDVERGRRSMIVSFLEVLDNLDRALQSAGDRPSNSDDSFVQGIAMVQRQFISTLEGLGVRRIDPLGTPFDPAMHEAVATVPASGDNDGVIVGVITPGYLLGDDVLRPAAVAVARLE